MFMGRTLQEQRNHDHDQQRRPDVVSTEPVLLDVSFADKDAAKSLGARYKADAKWWFVPPGLALGPFTAWIHPDAMAKEERRMRQQKLMRTDRLKRQQKQQQQQQNSKGNGAAAALGNSFLSSKPQSNNNSRQPQENLETNSDIIDLCACGDDIVDLSKSPAKVPVELPRADHAKIAQNRAQAMERRRLSAARSAVADAVSPSLGALRAQHSSGLGGASYFDCGLDEQALERAARSAEVQSTPQAKAAAARAGGGLGGGGCGSAAGAGQREAQQRESQQRESQHREAQQRESQQREAQQRSGGGGGGGRGGSSNRGKKRAAPSLRYACGCGADMSTQPANHTICYSCYKRGGSSQKAKPSHSPRRACQEPWQEDSPRHACGGAMDDDEGEGEEEVVSWDEAVEAWNMDGSSDAQAESGSWLRDAEEATGRRRGRCSFDGCPNQAEVGGHVWIKGEGCFIAPICRPCNRYDNPERMQGAGARLRANIDVTTTAMTEGMRNAERRIAVGGGGGGGGGSGGSRRAPRHRRECQECGTDINDRPANHSVCLGCFRGGGGGGSGGGGGRHSYGSGSPGSSDSSDSYY
jgi:hypothetical protein